MIEEACKTLCLIIAKQGLLRQKEPETGNCIAPYRNTP